MKNGRFVYMNFLRWFVQSMVPRCVVDDMGGGVAGEIVATAPIESTATDRFGNPVPQDSGKTGSPVPGVEQGASGKDASTDQVEKELEPAQAQAPVVSDEDLLKELDPVESVEAKAARLERDNKASAKEARRLLAENKAFHKAMEDQGLKVSVKDEKVNFIPTEKYSAEAAKLSVKVGELPASAIEAFESGDLDLIQPEIDKLMEKARSSFVRALPTLEKEAPQLSEEKKSAVFESMANEKDLYNKPKHENLTENKNLIESFINHPVRSQALRDLFAADPDLAAELVNNHINAVRARRTQRALEAKAEVEKKSKEAQQRTLAGVDGEGFARESGNRTGGATYDRYR